MEIECRQAAVVNGTEIGLLDTGRMTCSPIAEGVVECQCGDKVDQIEFANIFDACAEASEGCLAYIQENGPAVLANTQPPVDEPPPTAARSQLPTTGVE